MPSKKRGKRISFRWKGLKMYLPNVAISSDLRQRANDVYFGRNRKNHPKRDEEWNPSWSDEEVDGASHANEPEHRHDVVNNKGEVAPAKRNTKRLEKRSGEFVGEQLVSWQITKAPEEIKDAPANAKVGKYQSKKEIFKNWSGFQSKEKDQEVLSNLSSEDGSAASKDSTKNKNSKTAQTLSKSVTSDLKAENSSKSDELKCKECGKQFSKKIHLTLHEKIHAKMDKPVLPSKTSQKQHPCAICGCCFKRNEDLFDHLRSDHAPDSKESNEFVCKKCSRSFDRSNQLKFHMKLCKGQSTSVDYLEKTDSQPTSDNYVEHEKVCFICKKCNRSFDRSNQLKIHMQFCKGEGMSIDLKQTDSQPTADDLAEHGKVCFICKKCNRSFGRSNQLKFHSKLCKGQRTDSQPSVGNYSELGEACFVCTNCNRSFDRSNQLKFHKKLCKNLSKIKADAPHCSTSSQPTAQDSTESKLGSKDAFNDDKPAAITMFSCTDCHKQFKLRLHLSLHKRSHSKVCENCSLTLHETEFEEHLKSCFANNNVNSIISSLNDADNNDTALKCEICGSSFSSDITFSQHHYLHKYSIESFEENDSVYNDNLVPFMCQQNECKSRFSDGLDLDLHLRKKHNQPGLSNPTYYYSQDATLPPLNPYVLLTSEIKSLADAVFDKMKQKSITANLTPRVLKRRLIKPRGRQPRQDIPFQNFYVCEICDRRFNQRNLFLTHIAFHKRQKFACNLCERRFESESAYTAHVELQSDPNFVSCPKGRGRFRDDIPIQDEYICETCERKFEDRSNFLIHLSVHRREEMFTCKICDRKFQSESLYNAHVDLHKNPDYTPLPPRKRFRDDIPIQSQYTCETCGQKFKKRNYFLIHIANHKRQKFACNLCERRFESESAYTAHVELQSDPNFVSCPTKAKGRGRFRDDIPIQDEYTCETCERKFEDRSYFLIHIANHKREKFACNLCERRFESESAYTAHVELQSDPNFVSCPTKAKGRGRFRDDIPIQDEYTCETCERKFDDRNYFLIHLSVHRREEMFTCKICDRKFQSKSLYNAHVDLHKNPNYTPLPPRKRFRDDIPIQSQYTCETCGQKFKKRNYFLIHIAYHKRQKFACNLCERRFESESAYTAHVELQSDPNFVSCPTKAKGRGRFRDDIPIQDEYTCETCGQKFTKRNLFLTHISAHKREEMFASKLCPRKCLSAALLEQHLKRHSDPNFVPRRGRIRRDIPLQDVYTCETCQKTFENRSYFLIHLAQHKRDEKYRCNICHLKYPTSALFQFHMKRHTDPSYQPRHPRTSIPIQDVYNCDKCDRSFTNRQGYICHLHYHRNASTNKTGQKRVRKGRLDIPIQDVYYCEQCGFKKSFTDRMKYILHLRHHGLEKTHQCSGCLKAFKTVQARDNHFEKFCKKIPCKYKCDRCNDRFHNKITLARHFHRFHSRIVLDNAPEIEYPCNQCSQTFNTTFGLTRHCQIYHPVSEVTVERDTSMLDYENDDGGTTSPHSWNGQEDYHPLLAASFCEAELNETPSSLLDKTLNRKLSRGSALCQCGLNKKYRSQKFCHSLKCPCVQAGNRCGKDCNCDNACLNNNEMQDEQQQMFKEGKESMMQQEDNGEINDSIPVVIGYTENDSFVQTGLEPCVSSKIGYSKLIPTSEFITIDDSQDESMRQLSLEGYVEGAEDMDPLVDPLDEPEIVEIDESAITNKHGQLVNNSIPRLQETISVSKPIPVPAIVSSSTNLQVSTTSSSANNTKKSSIPIVTDSFDQSQSIRCQFCKKNFKIIPTYIAHVLLHDVEKSSLACSICSKEFGNKITTYAKHLDGHNKGIDLQCTKCSSKFKSYKDMDKHLLVHHFRPMECGVCTIKFPNSQLMMTHWSKVHPTCQCGLCNVKFFSYDDLTFHMKSIHSPYDCIKCNERFENLEGLLEHFALQHSSSSSHHQAANTQNYECTYCNERFTNGEDMNEHLSNHLSTSSQQTQGTKQHPANRNECHQCKATFTKTEDLHEHLTHHLMGTNMTPSNHQSSSHSMDNSTTNMSDMYVEIEVEEVRDDLTNDNVQAVEVLTCPKCEKRFHSKSGLRNHLLSHQLILCSACDSWFNTKEELLSHLQITSCVVLFCDHCDRNFQFKRYLQQHKNRVHDGEKRMASANRNANVSSPARNVGYFINESTRTENTAQLPGTRDNSFPVIVASTSLAQNNSNQSNPVTYIVLNRTQTRTECAPKEIEEIVLD